MISRRTFAATTALGALAAAAPVNAAPAPLTMDRGFVRIREGEVHFRKIGKIDGKCRGKAPLPLYMVHASPGSSAITSPLVERLGKQRACIAPDTLGAGDSPPPELAAPALDYYADSVIRIWDALGIEKVDFYGTHTGAHIGVEVALRAPQRVRRLILDGISIFSPEAVKTMLENMPSKVPEDDGGHLLWAWNYMRRGPSKPPADFSHTRVLEILKNIKTWNLGYRAAFAHDVKNRLPLLKVPALCMASDTDPMSEYVDQAQTLVPGAQKARVKDSTPESKAAAIEAFLNA